MPRPRERTWFAIQAKGEEAAEISIFDEIGMWGVTVSDFKREFDAVRKRERIALLLNSPGGSVFEGIALYNLLSSVRERLEVEVLGVAASIASVVALSGRELVMGEGSYLMIHDPWGAAVGDAEDLKRTADALEKMRDQLADIYTGRSNLSRDEVLARMSEETWFAAGEAVAAGFADRVVEHGKLAALAFDFSNFRHVPDGLIASETREAPESVQYELPIEPAGGESGGREGNVSYDEIREGNVSYDEIKEALGALSVEERTAMVAELGVPVDDEQTASLTGRIEALEKANEQLSGELEEARRREHEERREAAIKAALADGRIAPVDREFWEQRFDADPQGTATILGRLPANGLFRELGTGSPGNPERGYRAEERELLVKMGYSAAQIDGGN